MEFGNAELTRSKELEPAALIDGGLLYREAQVLGPGLAQGVSEGVSRSFNNLRQFTSDLKEAPGKTLSDFVANHWSEAALGAAITFISPKKWAGMLLAGASLRGVGSATFESAMAAASSRSDLNAVREYYKEAMAQETQLLVNSLPATLAGGAAGRAGASAVFGKGMGAWDLASGQVKMADVRGNLLKARDAFMPPKAKLAVFDLDGTLVSTARHLAVSIDEGTAKIASNTGLPHGEVKAALGEQFGKLQSFTHPWTVELALSERLNVGKPGGMTPAEFKSRVSDPYWRVLADTMGEHMKVYEGVKPVIQELRSRGLKVAVLTSSPEAIARARIDAAGLSGSFNKVFTLKHLPPPEGLMPELLQHGAERLARSLEPPSSRYVAIPRELRKPDPQVLSKIIEKNGLRPKEVMMIGDSLKDDMGVAANTGSRGLWARYSEVDAPFDARLNEVTGGNYTMKKPAVIPPYEAELMHFTDVLKHIRAPRDIGGYLRSLDLKPSYLVPLQSYGLLGKPERKS